MCASVVKANESLTESTINVLNNCIHARREKRGHHDYYKKNNNNIRFQSYLGTS